MEDTKASQTVLDLAEAETRPILKIEGERAGVILYSYSQK